MAPLQPQKEEQQQQPSFSLQEPQWMSSPQNESITKDEEKNARMRTLQRKETTHIISMCISMCMYINVVKCKNGRTEGANHWKVEVPNTRFFRCQAMLSSQLRSKDFDWFVKATACVLPPESSPQGQLSRPSIAPS